MRAHLGVDRVSGIGNSCMGLLVMLYALEHPDRVERVVLMGPVPMRYDATYPPELPENYAAAMMSAQSSSPSIV